MAETGKIFYYGCGRKPGHYFWKPGMIQARGEETAPTPHTTQSFPQVVPWGYSVDGKLTPPDERHADGRLYYAPQGKAALHYKDGWTAISFWDRSVDTRPGSLSTFVMEGTYDYDQAIALARQNFPEVFERFQFEVTPADVPEEPRLGAAPRNVMVGEYRDGVIRLNEHSEQWFNANYFKRLWLHSYPKYPFKELHVDHGEKPLHIPLKGDSIPPGGLEYDPEQVDTGDGGVPQEGEQAPGEAGLRQDLRESRQAARSPVEALGEDVTMISKWRRKNAKDNEEGDKARSPQDQGLRADHEEVQPSASEDADPLATPFSYDDFDLDTLPDRNDIARAWQHAAAASQDPWDTSLIPWNGVDQWVGQFGNAAQNVSYGVYSDIFDFAADAISKMQRLQVLGTAHKRTASTLGLAFLEDHGYLFPELDDLWHKSQDDAKEAVEEEFIWLIEGFSDSATHRTEPSWLGDWLREHAVRNPEFIWPDEDPDLTKGSRWGFFLPWRTLSEARI